MPRLLRHYAATMPERDSRRSMHAFADGQPVSPLLRAADFAACLRQPCHAAATTHDAPCFDAIRQRFFFFDFQPPMCIFAAISAAASRRFSPDYLTFTHARRCEMPPFRHGAAAFSATVYMPNTPPRHCRRFLLCRLTLLIFHFRAIIQV